MYFVFTDILAVAILLGSTKHLVYRVISLAKTSPSPSLQPISNDLMFFNSKVNCVTFYRTIGDRHSYFMAVFNSINKQIEAKKDIPSIFPRKMLLYNPNLG